MQKISAAQLRKIHVLSKERGLDDDLLHACVYSITRRSSLKDLNIAEAVKVIDTLEGKSKTADGMMTDKQRKFINGLLKEIGWVDEAGRADERRLLLFAREKFKVDRIEWLDVKKASQIIEALKAMKERMGKEVV